jgi:hypothetical protein
MEITKNNYDLEIPVPTHGIQTGVSSLASTVASAFGSSQTFTGVLVGSMSNTISVSTHTQHLDISFQVDGKSVEIKGQLDVTIDGDATQLTAEKLSLLEAFLSDLVSGDADEDA